MADMVLLRGGNLANMPQLQDREIVIAKDKKALYIGIGGVNTRLCGADDLKQVKALPTLAEDSDLSAVISAYNSLLSAFKQAE